MIKLLIIEDKEVQLELYRRIFEQYNKTAKEIIENTRCSDFTSGVYNAQSYTYDLILLDLGLPDVEYDKDLLMALKMLREAGIQTPVVVCSAYFDQKLVRGALELGAVDYLIKGDTNNRAIIERVLTSFERVKIQRRKAARRRKE